MSRKRVEDFGPHQDALRLFDFVVADMDALRKDPRCWRLIGQQVDSADSICANMEEGFGRLSRREFIRFLDVARGSARETLGRYQRLKHWLPSETIAARVELTDKIIARLTKAINTLRANCVSSVASDSDCYETPGTPSPSAVREIHALFGEAADADRDAVTDEEINLLLRIA